MPETLRNIRPRQKVRREAEIRNDHVIACVPDKGLGSPHRLRIRGASPQPVVEQRFSGGKGVQSVRGAQVLRDPSSARPHYFWITRRRARARRASAAFGFGGAASASQSSSKNLLGATVVVAAEMTSSARSLA